MAIPKQIHEIWLQGWNNLPEKYQPNIQSIVDQNPGWTLNKWDDSSIRGLLKSLGPQYLQKYDSFKILHQKVDFGRYAILYKNGGVSVDVDAKAVKGFETTPNINSSNFIVGYSPLDKTGNLAQGNTTRALNNSVIITSAYNPILKEVLDYILTLDCKPGQTDFSCIIFTTGQSFNEVLNKHRNEITVLENDYFESCHGNDEYCEYSSNAILQHKHAQTWVPENYQKIAKAYYWTKKNKTPLMIIIIAIVLFIFLVPTKD